MTDFVGHPFWAHPDIRGTFVGNAMTRDMLISHGVPAGKIEITGIPVNPDIAIPKDAAAIRKARAISKGPVVTLIGSAIDDDKVRRMVAGMLEREIRRLALCSRWP